MGAGTQIWVLPWDPGPKFGFRPYIWVPTRGTKIILTKWGGGKFQTTGGGLKYGGDRAPGSPLAPPASCHRGPRLGTSSPSSSHSSQPGAPPSEHCKPISFPGGDRATGSPLGPTAFCPRGPRLRAPGSALGPSHGVFSVPFTQHCKPISPPRGDTSASFSERGSPFFPHLHIWKGPLTIPCIPRFAQAIRVL